MGKKRSVLTVWKPSFAGDIGQPDAPPLFPGLAFRLHRFVEWLIELPLNTIISMNEIWAKADIEIGNRRLRFMLDLQRRLMNEWDVFLKRIDADRVQLTRC